MGSLRGDLERIYDGYSQQLFVCALAVTQCPIAAEDAIHDAFARLLLLEERPRDLRLYVFRSVRNAAVDLQRRRRPALEPLPTYVFAASDPREQADVNEFKERAATALLRLSEDERETIVQHLYAGLTFREIAELRGTPTNTVASWYRRGLEKLRRELESHDGQF